MDKSDLRTVWEYVVLIAPAPLGALIGMRYASQLAPRAQAINFLLSAALGAFGGWWAGELFSLSKAGVAIATIVICSVGMEIMAGLVTAARSFSTDPFGFAGKALDIVGRIFRRGQP